MNTHAIKGAINTMFVSQPIITSSAKANVETAKIMSHINLSIILSSQITNQLYL